MRATVRLFARFSELAGIRVTEVELGEGINAGDVYALLCTRYPQLSGFEGRLMLAVNSEYVTPDHPVRDGDDVALIPPVSGGGHAL